MRSCFASCRNSEFVEREHQLGKLPVWFSLDSSFGLERRSEPEFQTRQFVQRVTFEPRMMTALHWHGFDLAPSFGVHEIAYDSRITNNVGDRRQRAAFRPRCFAGRIRAASVGASSTRRSGWAGERRSGQHVIEPRVTYRYVTGIQDFNNVIRFDDADVLSNTNEVEFSLTNRLLAKDSNGSVSEVLSWQLWYKRYLDPTFGGAVIPGQPNVLDEHRGSYGDSVSGRAAEPVAGGERAAVPVECEPGVARRLRSGPARDHRQRYQRRPAGQATVRLAGRLSA